MMIDFYLEFTVFDKQYAVGYVALFEHYASSPVVLLLQQITQLGQIHLGYAFRHFKPFQKVYLLLQLLLYRCFYNLLEIVFVKYGQMHFASFSYTGSRSLFSLLGHKRQFPEALPFAHDRTFLQLIKLILLGYFSF